MAEPGDADSYVTITEPAVGNGRPTIRFITTTARDAAAIVARWCKIGYVYTADLGGSWVVVNFAQVTGIVTNPGSSFRGVGHPCGVSSIKPSAADIAKAHAALARQSEL